MNKKNRLVIVCIVVAIIVGTCGWLVWKKTASPTRIALFNFQPFQATSLVKSNTDNFVKYETITADDLHKIKRYDFFLAFGMGMNVSAEQREIIQRTADGGTPMLVYAATNPDNNISSLDSITKGAVSEYLQNGNRKNYQSLARYIRKEIDRKSFFIQEPDSVAESASDVLYHLDEDLSFKTVEEYEKYLRSNGYYREGGARIAIIGGLNDPFSGNRANIDSMIVSFQNSGLNVYPVSSAMKRMEFLRSIQPDAVVYYAHGRMAMGQADAAVDWLKERNIPVFAPLTILQTKEEWEKDPMGMFGGFLSQSIVMPELDGAIYPYVVNAQEMDDDGLYLFKAIPERLKSLTQIVNNFVDLRRKSNAEKKVAIYYFKGPGQETLATQGMEAVPSLYNLLKRLKAEGYRVENLPATEAAFEKLLMAQGSVFSTYAAGAFDDYLRTGNPALVEKSEYEAWIADALPADLYQDVVSIYGEAPGNYMSLSREGKNYLAVARIELGNIVLLPQPMAGLGDDSFAIVHGTKSAPPHTYIAAYLWSQYAFGADAMLHFGTHGSLEFTPHKQVALSNYDWPDRLVGTIPHFYYYTIGNIGESMMAKRRSYATTISYLTPPFMESNTRSQFRTLQDKIRDYYKTEGDEAKVRVSLAVKKIVLDMGLHRELRLDSTLTSPYTTEEIERLENFAEEIANEKMNGQMYITGVPYDTEKITSSVLAMSADPIAYSLAALDRERGKITDEQLKSKTYFTRTYLEPARGLVMQVLGGLTVDSVFICNTAGISGKELAEAKKILNPPLRGMAAMMAAMAGSGSSTGSSGGSKPKSSGGGHPSWIPKIGSRPESTKTEKPATTHPGTDSEAKSAGGHSGGMPAMGGMPKQPEYTREQKDKARAIAEVERTLLNITRYRDALLQSPELELQGILNALSGGYIAPSSGGDAVANPQAVPTGRNLYAINADATPSEVAWDKGVSLVNATLQQYLKQHGDYPRKVSYTFWSSEFIETEGATIAQVLYMLGVEPVRDAFGRVSDIRLIPSETLGRPRVDVVVQTSGQFRDLAASRLSLITRAVEMAAAARNDVYDNYVVASTTEIERQLVDQGVPPAGAREMSTRRVFGGVNGMYGTGIQEMVKSGDKWEDEQEIAETYIQNMGAVYGDDRNWGEYQAGLLRAVLHQTDVVVQPRQSNTWGALSLDHVFEFMGGINLAVRNVTGKDPDAYFADYRNRNNARMQDLKEAIGVESRSTVFNPAYIKEVMKGKASSASQITEVVTNTYAWNVMKPDVIDNEMWDGFYDIYVQDSYKLGVQDFFRQQNPAALQEITAVMLETARKGMWKATDQQLADVANLHTELVKEFGASGSGFSGSNAKLQDFIAQKAAPQNVDEYKSQVQKMKVKATATDNVPQNGTVLKKETFNPADDGETKSLNGFMVVGGILIIFVALLLLLRRKRKAK